MADWKQDNFTQGDLRETFTDQQAQEEFAKIREQLRAEAERIEVPESLSAERMMALLDDVEPGESKPVPVVNYKREYAKFIAYAACLVFVIGAFVRFVGRQNDAFLSRTAGASSAAATAAGQETPAVGAAGRKAIETAADPAAGPAEEMAEEADAGRTAQSYDEIYAMLAAVAEEQQDRYGRPAVTFAEDAVARDDGAAPASAAPEAPAAVNEAASMKTAQSVDAGGYIGTNTQIAGVDEADIVKTDGKYLYHFRNDYKSGNNEIRITAADGLKAVSTIELPELYGAEMYVSGDRLLLLASAAWGEDCLLARAGEFLSESAGEEGDVIVPDWYAPDEPRYVSTTRLLVFDISDRAKPREILSFKQAGSYVSSRLSEGVLYLVSDHSAQTWYLTDDTYAASVFPAVCVNGEARLLSPGRIYLPEQLYDQADYCVVTAYDLSAGKTETKAVLGSVHTMMMTGDTLILAGTVWDSDWSSRDTGVVRFAVGGGNLLRYTSSGRVPGWIDGQFALDVSGGLLRVATTSYGGEKKNETVNHLLIYDEKMDLVGSVEGLAEGERIYSVRYFGDTAYVVTFRETDPLFAIDLSDPKHPTVLGQLKIPGFSEYLHPAGDGLLIGVGQNTMTNAYGGVLTDGLKFSLFDVSDPADPKEIAAEILGNRGSYSEVLHNHKAFLYDGANQRFGLPATICRVYGVTADNPWGNNSSVTFDGYLVYRFGRDGFERLGALASEDSDDPFGYSYDHTIERGVVIGKTLYTAANSGLTAWDYETLEQTGSLEY